MKNARGFTLVELLVVIGIVGALLALLMPTLAAARGQARAVACLSNLRQLATAAQVYANANGGFYPYAHAEFYEGATTRAVAWDFTTISSPGTLDRVEPGLLWAGGGLSAVQQCPSYDGPSNTPADPFTGYNYNASFVGSDDARPAKFGSLRHAPEVALFGDGQYAGGANKFMRSPQPGKLDAAFTARWAGTQGYRHTRASTNVAYADGHAAAVRERFVENSGGVANVAPGTGFLSADNAAYGGR